MKRAVVVVVTCMLFSSRISSPPGEISLPASACRDGAMDERKLEQQVASVGRGIAFLEQEHLAVLTGLRLEITHLKRRCHGEPFHHCLAARSLHRISLNDTCLLLLQS